MVRFQSDAGTGGLLDAVDRLSPLPGEVPGAPSWTGGIPRPALSPSDSDNVSGLHPRIGTDARSAEAITQAAATHQLSRRPRH